MKRNTIYKIALAPALLLALQSCFVAREYERPQAVDQEQYRTDQLPEDSVTIAGLSWQELFTDDTLAAHIEEGLENNMDIRIALQRIVAAEAYFKQGKTGNLPVIGVGAQVTHQEMAGNSQFGSFFDGALNQYDLTANLSWEADIWGKIRSNKRAMEASYLQSVAAHQAVKTQLVANIASLYYQLLAFDEQKRIAEETIANRERSLETTRALKDAGTVTEVAVKQTEAQLYTAQALLVDLDKNIKLLENTFSILLGRSPGEIGRSSLEAQQLDPEMKTGYPVQLLRNRPDVIAAEYGLINAFELTNVAKSGFYPSLTLTATGGFQSLELDELLSANSLFANIIAGLTQPILNGRAVRTQYEVAQSQEEIAYLNFKQAILTASKEVSDALYDFQAAEETIEIKTREFEAYDTASEYSEELLNNGFANYLEVLTARENALNSQLGVINAEYSRLNSVVELYRALGGGWR